MSTRLHQYLFSVVVLCGDRTAAFLGMGGKERKATDEQTLNYGLFLFQYYVKQFPEHFFVNYPPQQIHRLIYPLAPFQPTPVSLGQSFC